MSQDYTTNRRTRRAARAQRTNKPVLVTDSDVVNSEEEHTSIGTATQTIDEPQVPVVPTPAPVEQPARRLPRFFSSVKKSEENSEQKEAKEAEIVQARLARATRSKAATEVPAAKTIVTDNKKVATPTTPTKATPAKPKGIFQTRYLIGIGIYIIVADFLGAYVQRILTSMGLEKNLTTLQILGGKLPIMTSTIVFLAILVIILVILTRFDLIPRNLGGASRAATTTQQTRSNGTNAQGERVMPPTIRQGVKGADDTLYQQYRSNQRKKK